MRCTWMPLRSTTYVPASSIELTSWLINKIWQGGVLEVDEERIKHTLDVICRHLSSSCTTSSAPSDMLTSMTGAFADPVRVETDLHKLANLNEPRIFKLLRTLMDSKSEVKTIVKARQEASRRIDASLSAVAGTVDAFITQSALLIYNRSLIPHLLARVQEAADPNNEDDKDQEADAASLALSHLQVIAKHRPELFAPSMSELVEMVVKSEDTRSLTIALYALSMLALQDAQTIASDLDR